VRCAAARFGDQRPTGGGGDRWLFFALSPSAPQNDPTKNNPPPTTNQKQNPPPTHHPPNTNKQTTPGTYIDKKCPFTGDVAIRGRILTGIVHSAKMQRTIVIRRDYLHYVKKYARYEKRHSNLSAHVSPCFRVREGDTVVVGQCRPLSKTVRFNVLRVIPAGASDKKAFSGF